MTKKYLVSNGKNEQFQSTNFFAAFDRAHKDEQLGLFLKMKSAGNLE